MSRQRKASARGVVYALFGALGIAACGGGTGTQTGPEVSQPNAATGAPATSSGATSSGSSGSATVPSKTASSGGTSAPASGTPATTAQPSAAAGNFSTSGGAPGTASTASAGQGASGGMTQPAVAGMAGAATTIATAGSAGTSSAANDGAPSPSMGCLGGSLKPGRSTNSIQSSGGNRSYIQYVPDGYDGMKPLPLVVDLHPYSVGASFAESSSGFKQLADSENYVYLAPSGMSNMWDSVGDTDTKFIRDLVNGVAAKGCIDLRRVYATGCSNGGAFSFLLMCNAEDIFAAVAPMCGTAFFDLESMCMLDRPVSLMLRLGKQDTLNCWEGEGMVLNAPNVPMGTRVQCAKTVQKMLSAKNHCKGQPKMMAQCEYLGDCDEGTEIAICNENTGHVVYQTNTAKDTWAFLKRFYKH